MYQVHVSQQFWGGGSTQFRVLRPHFVMSIMSIILHIYFCIYQSFSKNLLPDPQNLIKKKILVFGPVILQSTSLKHSAPIKYVSLNEMPYNDDKKKYKKIF